MQRARRAGRTEEFIRAAKESAELQKLTLQPRRYETINGAGEIGWGMAMLCFAISGYASVVLPASPWRTWIDWLFLAGACVAMPVCLWASRRFITWPRVGYVAYRRDPSWWTSIIVAAVIAAVLGVTLPLLMRSEIAHAAQAPPAAGGATVGAPSLTGTMMKFGLGLTSAALYLMINAVSIKEHRWKWLLLALIVIVPPGMCYFIPGNYLQVSRPMTLFLGVVWFISGVITLASFLRHHQGPVSEAE